MDLVKSTCAACKQAKNQTRETGASRAGKNNKQHVLAATSRQKMKQQSTCEACDSRKQKDKTKEQSTCVACHGRKQTKQTKEQSTCMACHGHKK